MPAFFAGLDSLTSVTTTPLVFSGTPNISAHSFSKALKATPKNPLFKLPKFKLLK